MFLVTTDFSGWLQEQMDARGWSPSDLARAAKVSPATISNVLNEERRPGPELCRALATALDVPQAVVFYHAGLLTEDPQDPRMGLSAWALQLLAEVANKPEPAQRAALAAVQALFSSLESGASERDNSRTRGLAARQNKS